MTYTQTQWIMMFYFCCVVGWARETLLVTVPSAHRGQPVLYPGLRSRPRSRRRVRVLGQLHRGGALGQRGGSRRRGGYYSVR